MFLSYFLFIFLHYSIFYFFNLLKLLLCYSSPNFPPLPSSAHFNPPHHQPPPGSNRQFPPCYPRLWVIHTLSILVPSTSSFLRAGEPPTTVLPIPLSFCESITSLSPSHAQCRTYGVGDLRALLCLNPLRAGPLDVTCTAANQAQSSFPAGPGCGQGVSPEPEATAALLLLAARILADLRGRPRSPGEALSHPSVPIPLVSVLPHLVRVPCLRCRLQEPPHSPPGLHQSSF